MKIIVARHGLSEANNQNNIGTIAFANPNALLMDLGKQQAKELGTQLRSKGFDLNCAVAVSELQRTQLTARFAGFKYLHKYSLLNEVSHGLPLLELRQLIDSKVLPQEAIDQANSLLNDPPKEQLWISHGLVIAGLCKVLKVHQNKRLIPNFCEIRDLEF